MRDLYRGHQAMRPAFFREATALATVARLFPTFSTIPTSDMPEQDLIVSFIVSFIVSIVFSPLKLHYLLYMIFLVNHILFSATCSRYLLGIIYVDIFRDLCFHNHKNAIIGLHIHSGTFYEPSTHLELWSRHHYILDSTP